LVDCFSKPAVPPGLSLPPARLRFQTTESTDAWLFFRFGRRIAQNLQVVLAESGHAINDFRKVLDFGCGCGRTLMWLQAQFPAVNWHGADVNAEMIEWCRTHIPSARFTINASLPPLEYPEATFDLVYAVSVFTHLSDEYQRAWIPELRRVLRPGGLLLITFHSEHVWKTRREAEEVERQGIVFCVSTKLKGIVPDWYQTTFQTSNHLQKAVSTHLTVIRYCPRGFGDHDAILARRD
ncbi:MAG: class I SAM-dependent methyltransferase, partial [Terriglobia bacterium]